MENGILIWIVLDLIATMTCVGLAGLVAVYRPPATLWPSLFLIMVGCACWSLGELMAQFFSYEAWVHALWLDVLYSGLILLVTAWLLFTFAYARHLNARFWFDTKSLRLALIVIAWILWLCCMTNRWHGLFLTPKIEGLNEPHIFWYVQAVIHYFYLLVSIVMLFILRFTKRLSPYKGQLNIMLLGVITPFIINAIFLSDIYPLVYDPTVVGFSFSALLYTLAVYKTRLFSLSPFTLQNLLENEVDPFLILNKSGFLLTMSEQAKKLFSSHNLASNINGLAVLDEKFIIVHDINVNAAPGSDIIHSLLECLKHPVLSLTIKSRAAPYCWYTLTSYKVFANRGMFFKKNVLKGINIRLREITEMIESHQLVSTQTAILENVLVATDQAILVVNGSDILFLNQQYRSLFEIGESSPALIDVKQLTKHISGLLADAGIVEKYQKEISVNDFSEARERFALLNGKIIERYTKKFKLDGIFSGRIWVFQDVTQSVAQEIELKAAQVKATEAQRLESLGIMAGGIAHDFNNILTAIVGRANLILEHEGLDADVRQDAMLIDSAANQAAELTDQIMSFAGHADLTSQAIDLVSLLKETQQIVADSVLENIAFSQTFEFDELNIQGDLAQLRRVFMNILINAAEALGGQSGSVSLQLSQLTVDSLSVDGTADMSFIGEERILLGRYARVDITDNGSGIDAKDLTRMFDPFYTTKFTGRGLGLAAALGIIKAHQGALAVSTTLHQGTKFSILIPIADSKTEPSLTTIPPTETPLKLLNVLIVDDERDVLGMIEAAFKRSGHRVRACSGGKEAIETYAATYQEVDFVILDLTMPDIDGVETLKEMSSINAGAQAIVMSGHAESEVWDRLNGLNVLEVVRKPFSPKALLALLQSLATDH